MPAAPRRARNGRGAKGKHVEHVSRFARLRPPPAAGAAIVDAAVRAKSPALQLSFETGRESRRCGPIIDELRGAGVSDGLRAYCDAAAPHGLIAGPVKRNAGAIWLGREGEFFGGLRLGRRNWARDG